MLFYLVVSGERRNLLIFMILTVQKNTEEKTKREDLIGGSFQSLSKSNIVWEIHYTCEPTYVGAFHQSSRRNDKVRTPAFVRMVFLSGYGVIFFLRIFSKRVA